jgi:hypothetical protein
MNMRRAVLAVFLTVGAARIGFAQGYRADPAPGEQKSSNMRVVGHLPLDATGPYNSSDIELEQELSRPYVYIDRTKIPTGFDIISIKDPARPKVIYSWRIEQPELHKGNGSLAPTYLKSKGRYYFFNGFGFNQGGPDVDLAAIVWDVTSLPDTSKIKEVARIKIADAPGGFHETFSYKHSNGQALVFTAPQNAFAYVYDIDRIAAGSTEPAYKIEVPETAMKRGWHDFYVGYDPATKQDRLFGAGGLGYYVFDITNPAEPKLITSVTGAAGVPRGHTFAPSPDGRYALTISEPTYQYAPARVFDLKPGLDGTVKTISRPVGAWMPDWRGAVHNFEVRWPYIFVAGQSDAFHVVNFMDPTNPYDVGFYVTRPGPYLHGSGIAGFTEQRAGGRSSSMYEGAWGIDVRNADGLIIVSDEDSGFWALKMDGFDSWNGHNWGMPNQSSAQDWDNGPDGAGKTKVS